MTRSNSITYWLNHHIRLFLVVLFLLSIVVQAVKMQSSIKLQSSSRLLFDRRSAGKRTAQSLEAAGLSLVFLSTRPKLAVGAVTNNIGDTLKVRFDQDILQQPAVSVQPSAGNDNTPYPDFLKGTWQVTQTLTNVAAPIGLTYLGGPNGLLSIAEKSFAESKSRLNQPVSLKLRFVTVSQGQNRGSVVVEDRSFNTQQRLNAFAGKTVVASVTYADTGASNRAAVLANGGRQEDPLQTVVVQFKGPAAQKTFVTSHGGGYCSGDNQSCWRGFEGQRSIFALTNESTVPPIFTDSESLWEFCRIDDDTVKGRLRLAGYLTANDKLYFDAKNRAVSLQDYTLDMKRMSD